MSGLPIPRARTWRALGAAVALHAVAAAAACAQTPAVRPKFEAFEVATIKPTGPDARGRYIRMQSAHEFLARNHAVKTLIAAAYNLSPQAISGGPAWVDSDHYDILAKAPGEVRPNLDEQMAMLRSLLADRFGLTYHRERKQLSIYALRVAKGGPTLTESPSQAEPPQGPPPLIFVLSPQGISLPAQQATMGELASVMQRAALDRPVVDQTGLAGRYDFTLEWTPDETQFGGLAPRENAQSSKPDLFAAIQQQLGLKLQATRGPVETLAIDHVERPSAN